MRKRAAGTTQVLLFPCAQIDKLRALRDWENAVPIEFSTSVLSMAGTC